MDVTEIIVILDRSGSMKYIKSDMEEALNEFLYDQAKAPGSANVTLVQFDTEVETKYVATPISQVGTITIEPRWRTALLDAVCKTVDSVGERLHKTPEDQRPGKVLVAIITDGQENASKTYTLGDVVERVRLQTDVYNWQFTYLGANQDAFNEASKLGISRDATLEYTADKKGIRTSISFLSACVSAYRDGQDFAYSDQDRLDANNQ